MTRAGPAMMALVAALAGCGTTSTYRVVVGRTAPTHRGEVAVLNDGAPLPELYAEVAVIQAIGRGTNADASHVIEGLRAEAASMGCDAVVRVHIDQGGSTVSATGVAIRRGVGPVRPRVAPAAPTPAQPPQTAPVAPPPPGDGLVAPWAQPPPS